jgi:very-short-patch-repair endonuclease
LLIKECLPSFGIKGGVGVDLKMLNLHLRKFSKENRKSMTKAEKKLWARIRNDQLGVRVLRQKVIYRYIADFYIANHKLIIEVDGESHNERNDKDRERDLLLIKLGYRVLRIVDYEISEDLEEVVLKIKNEFNS